jgi:hypothetical protein
MRSARSGQQHARSVGVCSGPLLPHCCPIAVAQARGGRRRGGRRYLPFVRLPGGRKRRVSGLRRGGGCASGILWSGSTAAAAVRLSQGYAGARSRCWRNVFSSSSGCSSAAQGGMGVRIRIEYARQPGVPGACCHSPCLRGCADLPADGGRLARPPSAPARPCGCSRSPGVPGCALSVPQRALGHRRASLPGSRGTGTAARVPDRLRPARPLRAGDTRPSRPSSHERATRPPRAGTREDGQERLERLPADPAPTRVGHALVLATPALFRQPGPYARGACGSAAGRRRRSGLPGPALGARAPPRWPAPRSGARPPCAGGMQCHRRWK